ncbi:hypothetical protein [Rubritalea tangerina]|uniref:hypothetical protein n=1 Tax=Rubritalea tangerina TaxID=430798 RepID=UPI0036166B77
MGCHLDKCVDLTWDLPYLVGDECASHNRSKITGMGWFDDTRVRGCNELHAHSWVMADSD